MLKLKVAYLEPDMISRDALAKSLHNFFELSCFDADVFFINTASEVIDLGKSGNVDIFACDLSLNDNAPLGLGVISDVKRACPWLFCIAVSRGDNVRMTEVDSRTHGYDLFIPKAALTAGVSALEKKPNYKERFQARFRYSPVRSVRLITDAPEKDLEISIAQSELIPIIRQVISYRLPLDEAFVARQVELEPLGGGRSASRVFVLRVYVGEPMQPVQPCVLKISKRPNAIEEAHRYETYVRWALPQHARVDLMASGLTVSQGAVMYSFAFGSGKVSTLRNFLEAADFDRSNAAISKLFNSFGNFWIKVSQPPIATLPQRYLDRYYGGEIGWLEEDSQKLRKFAGEHNLPIHFENHRVIIDGEEYPSVPGYLYIVDPNVATQNIFEWAVVHGDLNPGNVIVSNTDEVALIDFRDSGIGHRYEDWVTLEGCLRMFWFWKKSKRSACDLFSEFLAHENALNNDECSALPADNGWKLICNARHQFRQHSARPLDCSFYYGLAYYCFRLMRIEGTPPAVKVRVLATAYAAVKQYKILAGR